VIIVFSLPYCKNYRIATKDVDNFFNKLKSTSGSSKSILIKTGNNAINDNLAILILKGIFILVIIELSFSLL